MCEGDGILDFHYSVSTDKNIDEAVRALEERLKEHKFGVLWQLDLPAKLREKGVDYDTPYRILEVCNPHEAKRILNANPLIGYFLPCKIVVYESNGMTHIGLPKPTVLMDIIGDDGLREIAHGIEQALKQAIDLSV